MAKIIHSIVVLAVLLVFSGAAHAQLFGLTIEGTERSADTNTPRINGFGESSLYSIDPDTGNAVLIGPTGFYFCRGLDFHPFTNVLYAACFDQLDQQVLIIIDIETGAGTEVAPIFPDGPLDDMSFRSDGTLFASFRSKPGIFIETIDTNTGALNFLGFTGLFGAGNGIGFDQFNELFLAQTDMIPSLYLLNQSSGLASLVTDLTVPPVIENVPVFNSLDLNPDTHVMFASLDDVSFSYDNYLVTINTETGEVTNVGETAEGLEAIAFLNPRLSNIPTMSEYGMAAVGLALLSISIFTLYRRKRIAAD
ncbi:MAG: hypothetical protein ACREOP_13715 [Thermodesulfobacteriota bacterium]